MANKKQTIMIPKAVPKKRKAPKPKKVTSISIPKAEIKPTRKPKRKFEKKERPAKNFSSGSMQNNSLADAFAKAGLTADSFKKK
tara:strand:+ start:8503 stop:8754 length:252 start_codon:yes stop_codon:yes gene_type:complete